LLTNLNNIYQEANKQKEPKAYVEKTYGNDVGPAGEKPTIDKYLEELKTSKGVDYAILNTVVSIGLDVIETPMLAIFVLILFILWLIEKPANCTTLIVNRSKKYTLGFDSESYYHGKGVYTPGFVNKHKNILDEDHTFGTFWVISKKEDALIGVSGGLKLKLIDDSGNKNYFTIGIDIPFFWQKCSSSL